MYAQLYRELSGVKGIFKTKKNIGRKNFVELNQIADKESSFLL